MVDLHQSTLKESTQPVIELDGVELTARCNGAVERLSEAEFLLMEQFLRFPEKPLPTESMLETISGLADSRGTMADTDKKLRKLIATVNALHPAFPLLRRLNRDTWVFSRVRPPKKKR